MRGKPMPYRTRLLAGAMLAMATLGVTAGPAFAHAELLSSQPGYGDVLTATPERAVLAFSEPMELRGSRLSLAEARGKTVALGAPTFRSDDHRSIDVSLPPLPPGSYTLTWFFLGNDGHVMGGEVAFRLAGASDPAPVAAPAIPPFPGAQDIGVTPAPGSRPRFGAVALAGPEPLVRVSDYTS